MLWHKIISSVWLLVATIRPTEALICSRYPINTLMPKSPVDENFLVTISGNPQTYILGQEYNVTIQAFNGLRFISFKLALENENGDVGLSEDLGHFEILDPVETRYSPNCVNMVESTNTNPKTRIDVQWVAPEQKGNGCVLIRTMLLQHRDVWFMDDGGLTRKICEESADDVETAPTGEDPYKCCACDEARYELTFEGMWSRNLHPKDFPAKGWITRFSDIIGASHTADYSFWKYGEMASDGMKEFAEHGSALTLEREFNNMFKEGNIRTIIKARGPAFPNLNGQSVASVRADPQRHLLSLASKIDPSPDWIVGLSGFELCMSNCTWLEQKTITLYPWDVGTDAGPSYTSPDQPQIPADVIRRIRSNFPNDPRSPFYDETGAQMKPLAVLKIKRQRLYERLCEDEDSNNFDLPRECFTHPWTAWSECTAKCGEGRQFRTRVYKQPEVARIFNCDVETRQDRTCRGEECSREREGYGRVRDSDRYEDNEFAELLEREDTGGQITRADCLLTSWSVWSPCSRTCGEGRIMRRRQYANPMLKRRCQRKYPVKLVNYQTCVEPACPEENQDEDEEEKGTEAEEDEEGADEKDEAEKGEEEENEREDEGNTEAEDVNEGEAKDEKAAVDKNNEDEAEEEEAVEEEEEMKEIEQGKPIRPVSSWQQSRDRNRYNYRGRIKSNQRNRARFENAEKEEADEEDGEAEEEQPEEGEEDEGENEEEGEEEEQEGQEAEEDVGADEEDDAESENSIGKYYNFKNRYNMAGRRKTEKDEADPDDYNERTPSRFNYYNRYSTGNRLRNNRNEEEEPPEDDEGEEQYSRSNARGKNRVRNSRKNRAEDEETDVEPPKIPPYCFTLLKIRSCKEKKPVRNYWFYNYCEDLCMLYTADTCDRNANKFNSLEACEETCRPPGNEFLVRRKQKLSCFKSNEIRQNKRRKNSWM
ncbi:unnamed protein product [Ceratitis capitata]|uniref:Spondin-1 n=2 Tax=Ceratitis capitata TaxID=7213 RepID=A0A811VAD2_CERCA|nr:unnamed protein product [Ceratitis capitata]